MIKINNEMINLIVSIDKVDLALIEEKVQKFSKKTFHKIKCIDDKIIVLDLDNEIESQQLDDEWVINQYGDYTGYEASVNEMRVNSYINISDANSTVLLLKLIDELKRYLQLVFSKYQFTIIGSVQGQDIDIRFHVVRQNEVSWLCEDIDSYSEALAVCII